MQLSKKEYEILVNLKSMIENHKDLLNPNEQELLENADRVLAEVFVKHQKINRKTAEYIAQRRLVDKNYARSK